MIYEIKVPEAGFNITEAVVSSWLKSLGETVQNGESVVTVETDKINVEVPAEGSGILREIFYQEGETAPVGGVLGIIAEEGEAFDDQVPGMKVTGPARETVKTADAVKDQGVKSPADSPAAGPGKKRRISPTAKAMARAHGVDLSAIPSGSGPKGRIVKSDVLEFIKKKEQRLPEKQGAGEREKVKFTGWRKVIADRMTASVREVPHYNNAVEVDVTDLSRMIAANRRRKTSRDSPTSRSS